MPAPAPPPDGPCVFCEIAAKRSPAWIVHEDAATVAFLDIFPFTRGHLLVIPREHGARLTDLTPEAQRALIRSVAELCGRVERLAPDYNVALNAGAAAGQIVFHVHFHVIPRYGEANPFRATTRAPLEAGDARKLLVELARP